MDIVIDAELPDWLRAELPGLEPHGLVEPDGPVAVIYNPPGAAPAQGYESVQVAYEVLRDVDLEFSADLLEREVERSFPGALTFAEDDGENHTMWFARNDARSLRQLESDYRDALKRAEAYRRSGGRDFLTAYSFIDGHPAFWIRPDRSGNHALWHWETDGHMNRVELSAWRGDDGKAEIGLETGSHTPEMTEHFHDPGLNVVAVTFEEAVLELARQVAVKFSDDGSKVHRHEHQQFPEPDSELGYSERLLVEVLGDDMDLFDRYMQLKAHAYVDDGPVYYVPDVLRFIELHGTGGAYSLTEDRAHVINDRWRSTRNDAPL